MSSQTLGVQIGIVLGGGNIFRGLAASARAWIRRRRHHGDAGDVINSLALQHTREKRGCYTRVMSAIEMARVLRALTSGGAPFGTSRRAES